MPTSTRRWPGTSSTGSTDTVIAVMDSGHRPDPPRPRRGTSGRTPARSAGNGVDDDANGFVDDVNGYDFTGSEDPNPLDAVGHGTHVAGHDRRAPATTASASPGSPSGPRSWSCACAASCGLQRRRPDPGDQLRGGERSAGPERLARRVLHDRERRRAALRSSPTPRCSTCSPPATTGERRRLAGRVRRREPVPVIPVRPRARRGARSTTSLCVAATTQTDDLAGFSNFGATSVDLGAPGINILSSNAERQYLNDPLDRRQRSRLNWNGGGG